MLVQNVKLILTKSKYKKGENMRSSIRKFANFNCEAQAPSSLPALGFAFNATSPQFATLFTPLLLPSTGPNPNITVPVINDTISTGTGIKIQVAGIYQISYTLTISLDNVPLAPRRLAFLDIKFID